MKKWPMGCRPAWSHTLTFVVVVVWKKMLGGKTNVCTRIEGNILSKKKQSVCLDWVNVLKIFRYVSSKLKQVNEKRKTNRILDGRKRKINTRNDKIQKGRERRNTRLAPLVVGLYVASGERVAPSFAPASAPYSITMGGTSIHTHTHPGYLPVPPFSRFWHVRTERMCIKT